MTAIKYQNHDNVAENVLVLADFFTDSCYLLTIICRCHYASYKVLGLLHLIPLSLLVFLRPCEEVKNVGIYDGLYDCMLSG